MYDTVNTEQAECWITTFEFQGACLPYSSLSTRSTVVYRYRTMYRYEYVMYCTIDVEKRSSEVDTSRYYRYTYSYR